MPRERQSKYFWPASAITPADMALLYAARRLRLRLRGLFTAAIEDLAGHYEARSEWERAIDCYRRGVEADDLVEEFGRRLKRLAQCAGASQNYLQEPMSRCRRLCLPIPRFQSWCVPIMRNAPWRRVWPRWKN